MMRQFNGNADDKDYYYKDYLGQLCFFDGKEDWIIDVDTGERRIADWFWYLEK